MIVRDVNSLSKGFDALDRIEEDAEEDAWGEVLRL
jgi:hypothetical protein